LKREMEAYYCSPGGQLMSPDELMEAALDSSCGTYCTAKQAEDTYQAAMQWFNREKGNLCKFPRKPDYP
jgi:hypothetical protein